MEAGCGVWALSKMIRKKEGDANQGPHMAAGRLFSHNIPSPGTGLRKEEMGLLRCHFPPSNLPRTFSCTDPHRALTVLVRTDFRWLWVRIPALSTPNCH